MRLSDDDDDDDGDSEAEETDDKNESNATESHQQVCSSCWCSAVSFHLLDTRVGVAAADPVDRQSAGNLSPVSTTRVDGPS